MANQTKKSYFRTFFKEGYFIPAALIGVIITGVLAAEYQFKVVRTILKNSNLAAAVITTAAILGVLAVVYLALSVKNKKFTAADPVSMGVLVGAVFYFVFVAAVVKFNSTWRVLLSVAMLLFGTSIVLLNSVYRTGEEDEKVYAKKTVKAYYGSICDKYSFLTILIGALLLDCIWFMLINRTARIKTVLFANALPCILIALIAIFFIASIKDRKTGIADATAFSAVISFPAALFQVIFANVPESSKTTSYICLATLVILFAAFTVIRYYRFDVDAESEAKLGGAKYDGTNYFVAAHKSFGLFSAIAFGAALVLLTLVLFRYTQLKNYLTLKPEVKAQVKLYPYLAINGLCYASLVMGGALALVNACAKKITLGDFMLLTCLSYTIFGLISFAFYPAKRLPYLMAAAFVCCLVILVIRIRTFSKRK